MESTYVLVLSDTHGNRRAIDAVLCENRDVEYIFHLGDCISDARYIDQNTRAKVICVKGNCDAGSEGEEFTEVVVKGRKILLTHGHLYKVKYSYDRLFYKAKEQEVDAALFGHTHRQYCEYEDGIWMVNPGSAGGSEIDRVDYATLLIGKMGVIPKLKTLYIK